MLDLERRGVVVSLSVLSGCIFLYNAWGPILAVSISLFLVVYACYSLIANDSLISPHAFLLLDYLKEAVVELAGIFDNFVLYLSKFFVLTWNSVKKFYREHFSIGMERRRISNKYQLSSDTNFSPKNASSFSLISQLSPIPRNTDKQHLSNSSSVSENKLQDTEHHLYNRNNAFDQFTSTPVSFYKKEACFQTVNDKVNKVSLKRSPMYAQNHTLTRGENSTYFTPEGSPWGMSISPKMRSKAGGVKTVQTVAGPLLASTRYNIDPKTYTDVTSPGLTMRLTKYATEANSKLTHQSQYGAGQFPKINLYTSPVPLINAKSAKLRAPVTVRVAPPDTTRYSPPEKQKVLSSICQPENKATSNVVQVLREISLKRHASREDVTSEIAKKQRTDGLFTDEVESFEETKQKRSREESSKSEEDISPENKNVRPTKRTKAPCYDILRSLSSSVNVASGVKRKAVDFSWSGTPDFEKHFKSLENTQIPSSTTATTQIQNVDNKTITINVNKEQLKNSNLQEIRNKNNTNKAQEHVALKGILKSSSNLSNNYNVESVPSSTENVKSQQQTLKNTEAMKLTDKLFMRAEPQRNEKLRSLVEEQGQIKATFTTDDVEEIKKEDIVNMRQTSMKARLQSMFDAISGKTTNKANPNVVTEAEEVIKTVPATLSFTDRATLNSLTTTTTVNTAPISTSAVTPSLSTFESDAKPTKHITFNLPNAESTPVSIAQTTKDAEPNGKVIPNATLETSNTEIKTPQVENTKTSSLFKTPSFTPINTNVPTFTSDKANTSTALSTSTTILTSSTPTTSATVVVPQTTSTLNIFESGNIAFSTTATSTSGTLSAKNSISNFTPNIATTAPTVGNTSSSFTFGSNVNTTASPLVNIVPTQNATTSNENSVVESAVSSANANATLTFKTVTSTTENSASSKISAATTATPFVFGTSNIQTSKSGILFGTSTNSVPNTFGNPVSSAPSSTTLNSTSTVPSTSNSTLQNSASNAFSGSTSSGSMGFNLNTTSVFSFGTPSVSTTSSKPMFSFTTNTSSASNSLSTQSSTTAPNSSTTTTSIPAFGTTSTTAPSQFALTTPMFSTTPATTMFGTTNNQPVFGGSTSSGMSGTFDTPKATVTPVFGSITPATSSVTPSLFSNISASTNTTTNTSTTSSMFGTNNNMFGEMKAPATFNTNTPTFGTTNTSLFGSQTSTTPAFGSNNTTTNSITFGTNTATPAFGTPTGAQNSLTSSFGTCTPMFGTENNPAPLFGSTTGTTAAASSGSFNSSITNNTFGTQNTNTISFGANSNAFGSNKPSPFGVQTSNSSTFGTNESNNTNAVFTFGGTQGQQQNTAFSFGNNASTSNNTGTASTAAVPFQFGANTSKPATGFNFSAPSSTPSINFGASATPTFSAPATGMFSIGSGSTAPRSRTVRGRKPR